MIAIWAAVLAASLGVWLGVGSRYANDFHLPRSDSQSARDLLRTGFPAQSGDQNQVVFRVRRGTLLDPAARRQVDALVLRLRELPGVSLLTSPFAARSAALSRDRTIGYGTLILARAGSRVEARTLHRVEATAKAARTSSLEVELGGPSIEQAQQTAIGSSMVVGLCAAVVVLLLSFGSLLAMGLPLVTALAGLGAGIGLVALVSRAVATPTFSEELALMIGLGVGVDYALFVVTRYREAYRANGHDVRDAVAVSLDTSGRAVIFAGLTVVVSLLGMCALRIGFLYGLALTSSLAVLLVLVASVTLLPALIGSAGHRIGRVGPLVRRLARPDRTGAWERWIRAIQRHPWWAAASAAAIMLVLASPVLDLRLGNTDAGNDPQSLTTRRAYDLLAEGFGPGFNGPLLVAAQLPRRGDDTVLEQLAAALHSTPDVAAVSAPRVSPDGTVGVLTVTPASSPQSARTSALISRLRRTVIPPLARTAGAAVYVGGFTAIQIDFAHVIASKLWLFVLAVTLVSAIFLLVVFRSLLIPLQAALMNLLSIGASLGVVVAVFQWGWLGGVFGTSGGPIQPFLPVMVFAIVFGLSMDYEIFLVSRIHEAWVHGASSSEAVRLGLTRSARVVTAAAAVMVAVFASFMLAGDRTIRPFGLGLASAVLLDAVVIRCLFLPALLEILGRATWWFPTTLDRRLPKLAIDPPEELLRRRPKRPAAGAA